MRRLHPFTILVALLPKLREAVQLAIPLLIGSAATRHGVSGELAGSAIALLTGFFAIAGYWTTRFQIEEDHVSHRTGWLVKNDRRIPLNQIQNVNLRQNLLERLLRVATVDVETAMGKGRDLKLSVLGLADAERFREELLEATHLGGIVTELQEKLLVSLNRHDLLLGAITENHLKDALGAAAVLSGPVIGAITRMVAKYASAFAPLAAFIAFFLIAIGGWVWGAISYYLKFGDFTVRRDNNLFRISYGLTNRVQTVIKLARIEYLSMSMTLPQRWMGRASLHVGTASTFGEAGVLAPVALFVDRHRAERAMAEIVPGLDVSNLKWHPFHPVFYRSVVIRALLYLAALAAGSYWLIRSADDTTPTWFFVLVGVLALVFASRPIGLYLASAENGVAVTNDALVVRRGYLHQTISAMPISRMENLAVKQSFLWKRFRASRVTAQAMKQKISAPAVSDELVEELLNVWRSKIASEENQHFYEIPAFVPEEVPETVSLTAEN